MIETGHSEFEAFQIGLLFLCHARNFDIRLSRQTFPLNDMRNLLKVHLSYRSFIFVMDSIAWSNGCAPSPREHEAEIIRRYMWPL